MTLYQVKALKNNRIVASPAYSKIIMLYNEELKETGKVNNKKFFEKHVAPEIPNYSMQSWYQFLKRFKTEVGLIAADTKPASSPVETKNSPSADLARTLLSNQQATASFIQSALNIGADRAKMILENPQLLTAKEALDLSIKAMKAQDSRIHAIGKLREDNREQERFDRTFSEAAY
jgi:hypothetical protein